MLILSDIILTYSGYILDYPWPCLASGEGTKNINRGAYIVIASIESTCTRDIYIDSTCAMGTWIKYAGIGGTCIGGICVKSICIRDVEPRILAGLRVTLAGPGVKD